MFSEFRKFIVRGNVIDLAVGIVIGAAFGTVVKSFVDDILNRTETAMPQAHTFLAMELALTAQAMAESAAGRRA